MRAILLVLLSAAGTAQICGDCNGDGVGYTVVDALLAAQIDVGLVIPTPAHLVACEVDGAPGLTVLDALVLAQVAAGLPPPPGHACNRPPTCAILAPVPGPGPYAQPLGIEVRADDPDQDPLVLTVDASTDGGVTWTPLRMHLTSPSWNPAAAVPAGSTLSFAADLTRPPLRGQPGTVDVRVTVDDGRDTSTCTVWGVTTARADPEFLGVPLGRDSVVFVLAADQAMTIVPVSKALTYPGFTPATAWEALAEAVEDTILTLDPSSQTFGLVTHDGSFTMWRGWLELADPANQQAAIAWLRGHVPAGGTVYTPAASSGINIGGGPPNVIVMVEAGWPNEGLSALSGIIAANGGRVAISTCHADPWQPGSPTAQLLQDLATLNGGTFIQLP
jgi:hypothetical protein